MIRKIRYILLILKQLILHMGVNEYFPCVPVGLFYMRLNSDDNYSESYAIFFLKERSPLLWKLNIQDKLTGSRLRTCVCKSITLFI
ncbi:MAG: hypothetical protein KAQ62_09550, partial [Cyclobacteriaceae bacterium]|nr:hypothetical protein [Cyclobacteriaceae bacterium]